MLAQTTWRPWPFGNAKTEPQRLHPLRWVVCAQKTGCNVKPKSATQLSGIQLERMRAEIRNHIEALGLTDQLGVKQKTSATFQITIYHHNRRHAHGT